MENELHQEAELQRPKIETPEEGEGSGMGASEEEGAWYKDEEKDRDERTTTSGEEIDGPNQNVEQNENVSDGDKDVDR